MPLRDTAMTTQQRTAWALGAVRNYIKECAPREIAQYANVLRYPPRKPVVLQVTLESPFNDMVFARVTVKPDGSVHWHQNTQPALEKRSTD